MAKKSTATPAVNLSVEPGFYNDYKRFKSLLNKGRHPAFIGRDMVKNHSRNGGLFFYKIDGQDIAASLINPRLSVLLVLNVLPEFRGSGYGKQIVDLLVPNFVRALEERVGFFESLGYKSIGPLKMGRSLKTQLMVRENLLHLSGRVKSLFDIDGD